MTLKAMSHKKLLKMVKKRKTPVFVNTQEKSFVSNRSISRFLK